MQANGLDDFDANVRLWGRGKGVQINGLLNQEQLRCLGNILEFWPTLRTATLLSPEVWTPGPGGSF